MSLIDVKKWHTFTNLQQKYNMKDVRPCSAPMSIDFLTSRGLSRLPGALVGSHGPWSAPRSRGYSPMVSWLLRALVGSQEPWLSGVWS